MLLQFSLDDLSSFFLLTASGFLPGMNFIFENGHGTNSELGRVLHSATKSN